MQPFSVRKVCASVEAEEASVGHGARTFDIRDRQRERGSGGGEQSILASATSGQKGGKVTNVRINQSVAETELFKFYKALQGW